MSVCAECGKRIEEFEEMYYIEDSMEAFCYNEIEYIDDVYNSCIGKNMIGFYSAEFILDLLNKDLDEREINVFYTTGDGY